MPIASGAESFVTSAPVSTAATPGARSAALDIDPLDDRMGVRRAQDRGVQRVRPARRYRRYSARGPSAAPRPRPARSIGRTIWRCCRHFPRSCRRCSSGGNNATSADDDQARDAEGSAHGSNAPQPVRTLRDWLDHLARARPARGDQAERQPAVRGRRLCQAARRPARHGFPEAGRPSDAGGVRPRSRIAAGWPRRWASSRPRCVARFQEAALNPIAVAGGEIRAGAGGGASRGRSGAAAAAADPQRARRRALHQRRPDDRAQSEDRKAERLDPPLPAHRAEPARRAAAAAPHPRVLRHGRGERAAARRRHRGRRRSADLAGLAGDRADRLRRAGDRRRAAGPAAAGGEMRHQRHPRAGRGRDRDRRPLPAEGARAGRPVRRIPAILRRAAPSGM